MIKKRSIFFMLDPEETKINNNNNNNMENADTMHLQMSKQGAISALSGQLYP